MNAIVTEHGPILRCLLDVQREMSIRRPPGETVAAFIETIRRISPAEHIAIVAPAAEPDARDGSADPAPVDPPDGSGATYRVLFFGPISRPRIGYETVDALFADRPGASPLLRGGLIGAMIAGPGPALVAEVAVDPDDPVLGPIAAHVASAMSIPVFQNGVPSHWIVNVASRPGAFQEVNLITSLGNSNTLVRSIAQGEMLEQVRRLNGKLELQLEQLGAAQRSLLPVRFPDVESLAFASSYEPCEAAGGDYYDFMVFPDGRVGALIADVSGHGPAAAVVMAMMRTTMSGYKVFSRPPQTIVEDVNRVLVDALHEGVFVTAFFGLFDPHTGHCDFWNCGHPPPRVRRADGTVVSVGGDASPPLGILDELEPAGGAFDLGSGDAVVLYTDGITEAFDPEHRMFGPEALDRAIGGATTAPDGIVDSIRRAVAAHAGVRKRDDDQTLLVIMRRMRQQAAGRPSIHEPEPAGDQQ